MFDINIYFKALIAMSLLGLLGWIISVVRRNVTLVDSLWSLFLLLASHVYFAQAQSSSARASIILILITVWALRLSLYLTWRNWGPHEDHRYQAIRRNNEPHFWVKSLYIVFGLQVLLAWVISLPLLAGILTPSPLRLLDYLGIALFTFGFVWQVLADGQLVQFKRNPDNKNKVLRTGVWRYSRHPNYFGECCIWWAMYTMALSAGAWWSIVSPILMTLLLLKVSGVSLLEKDIAERRPQYLDYIQDTNAFIPGRPVNRKATHGAKQ
jgi:steroid 5-alpha reductase family enzyme